MAHLKTYKRLILRFTRIWRHFFKPESDVIVIAILVGIVTAFAAQFLHFLVSQFTGVAAQFADFAPNMPIRGAVIFLLPLFGIFLSNYFQTHYCAPGFGKSLAPLILKLDRHNEAIPSSEMFTHIISSAISVGFGGSAGLEAPSVLTGAAIGSNISRIFLIRRMPRSMIVSCGAAAAIAAIFDSPIAGVLFVVEALLPEFTVPLLIPPLVSSAVSSAVTHSLDGHGTFFMSKIEQWHGNEVIMMFACGIVCAIIGAFIIKSCVFVGKQLHRLKSPNMRLLCGGLCASAVLFVFPELRSQGYASIEQLLIGDDTAFSEAPFVLQGLSPILLPIVLMLSAIILKPAVSALTIESGGDGGIFAPSMFIGAFTGFAFARCVNMLGIANLSECNFTALGMCGVFTTVMRSPLAGIFLIAETTGGFVLLVPLMIVASVAMATGKLFEPHSIYKKSLIARGLISDDFLEAKMKRIPVRRCITRNEIRFSKDTPMQQALDIIENTHTAENHFPVLDEDDRIVGFLTIEKLFTAIVSNNDVNSIKMADLMDKSVGTVFDTDALDVALMNMEKNSLKFVPVVSKNNGKYLGFVSKDTAFEKLTLGN